MRKVLLWAGVSCILCVGRTTVTYNPLPLQTTSRRETDARYYAAAVASVLADPSRRGMPVASLAGDGPVEALEQPGCSPRGCCLGPFLREVADGVE